jgi:hypothetical protein
MKKRFIITMLLVALVLTGCSSKGEDKKERFDATVTELVETLNSKYVIGLTPVMVIDAEEKGTKIASYTCPIGNSKNIHYMVHYDETTDNVSYISFFFDKNIGDIKKALTYYYIHIGAIAEIIEPTVDIGAIYDEISNVNGVNEGFDGSATYKTEEFYMSASCDDTYFHANFTPIETYLKGIE